MATNCSSAFLCCALLALLYVSNAAQVPVPCKRTCITSSFMQIDPKCDVKGAKALQIKLNDGCFFFNFDVDFCSRPIQTNVDAAVGCMQSRFPSCQGDAISRCVFTTVEKCIEDRGEIVGASAIG